MHELDTLYSGDTARIISDPHDRLWVYKVASPNNEAYLDNEQAAYSCLDSLGIRNGILTASPVKTTLPERTENAIRLENIYPGGSTLQDFVAMQEGLGQGANNSDLSESLKGNIRAVDDDKFATRISILLGILNASDNYIEHLSQNDIRPENVAVYDDGKRVKIFDFNRAITHKPEYRKGKSKLTVDHLIPLTGIVDVGEDYETVDGIHMNKVWTHPGMLDGLETILETSTVKPEQALRHSELYQATNVLYWMLTGRNLKDSNETVVSKLPILYRPIAVQVDKLIEEVKKPLGSYDQEKVDYLRGELARYVSLYRQKKIRSRPVVVSSGLGTVSGFRREAGRLSVLASAQPVQPFHPSGVQQELVDANAAMQVALDGYVRGDRQDWSVRLGELQSRVAGLHRENRTLTQSLEEERGTSSGLRGQVESAKGYVESLKRKLKKRGKGDALGWKIATGAVVTTFIGAMAAIWYVPEVFDFRRVMKATCPNAEDVDEFRQCIFSYKQGAVAGDEYQERWNSLGRERDDGMLNVCNTTNGQLAYVSDQGVYEFSKDSNEIATCVSEPYLIDSEAGIELYYVDGEKTKQRQEGPFGERCRFVLNANASSGVVKINDILDSSVGSIEFCDYENRGAKRGIVNCDDESRFRVYRRGDDGVFDTSEIKIAAYDEVILPCSRGEPAMMISPPIQEGRAGPRPHRIEEKGILDHFLSGCN